MRLLVALRAVPEAGVMSVGVHVTPASVVSCAASAAAKLSVRHVLVILLGQQQLRCRRVICEPKATVVYIDHVEVCVHGELLQREP